jgi:hypothetical protein
MTGFEGIFSLVHKLDSEFGILAAVQDLVFFKSLIQTYVYFLGS